MRKPDPAHEEMDALLQEMERKVKRVYSQAAAEMDEKYRAYLEEYEEKNKLKLEALKRGEITKEEYTRWRTSQIMVGKRWEAMRDTLVSDLQNADKIAESVINGYMPEAYASNFNYGTYEIEHGAKVNTSFTLYSRETIERLIKADEMKMPEAALNIPKKVRWSKQKVTSAILQGILQGESIPKMAARIMEVSQMNQRMATRTARTLVTGAENAGRQDSYRRAQELGIELENTWIATLDGRTRHSHRQLDAVSVPVGEAFDNGCRYPGDPDGPADEVANCRCTLIAKVKGIDMDLRNTMNRNTDHLGDMTYDEWQAAHLKGEMP